MPKLLQVNFHREVITYASTRLSTSLLSNTYVVLDYDVEVIYTTNLLYIFWYIWYRQMGDNFMYISKL